jgi:esterase/lipase superfamily enzyme
MNREYHRWYSPRLGREMELLVFGHSGTPLLVFPTSLGRFFEYEDRGMISVLAGKIDGGGLQVYCVDSGTGRVGTIAPFIRTTAWSGILPTSNIFWRKCCH